LTGQSPQTTLSLGQWQSPNLSACELAGSSPKELLVDQANDTAVFGSHAQKVKALVSEVASIADGSGVFAESFAGSEIVFGDVSDQESGQSSSLGQELLCELSVWFQDACVGDAWDVEQSEKSLVSSVAAAFAWQRCFRPVSEGISQLDESLCPANIAQLSLPKVLLTKRNLGRSFHTHRTSLHETNPTLSCTYYLYPLQKI
jgi:hypothetical protein